MFAAVTGDADTCRERAATARTYALARGRPAALAQWAFAFLDLADGRFAGAAARLRALAGFGPGHGHHAIRHLATPHCAVVTSVQACTPPRGSSEWQICCQLS